MQYIIRAKQLYIYLVTFQKILEEIEILQYPVRN